MSTWIVRETAPGPGLRVAVKDLIDVAGLPTTAGSRAVAERAVPAPADASCLAGLRAAMARGEASLAGKTNLHELAYGISGINAAFGTPVNPLDPLRVPGGSSSGSAVPWPAARPTSPTAQTPGARSASRPRAAG